MLLVILWQWPESSRGVFKKNQTSPILAAESCPLSKFSSRSVVHLLSMPPIRSIQKWNSPRPGYTRKLYRYYFMKIGIHPIRSCYKLHPVISKLAVLLAAYQPTPAKRRKKSVAVWQGFAWINRITPLDSHDSWVIASEGDFCQRENKINNHLTSYQLPIR